MSNYPQNAGYSQPYGQPQGQFGPAMVQGQGWGQAPMPPAGGRPGFGPAGFGNAPWGNGGFGNQWNAGPQGYPPPVQPGRTMAHPGPPLPQQPAPKKASILPAVLIVAVALVAVIALVKVTTDGGPSDPNVPAGYKNDDYQVPPAAGQHPDLPKPATEAEMEQWLTQNALYGQQIAKPVRCQLPAFDHVAATAEAKKAQLELTLVCLVRFWGPTLESAGFTVTHPTVTMYDAPIQNACGKAETHNAFYCGADQNLYFATDVHEILGAKQNDVWAYEAVMAHEFGHSVQGRIGIVWAKAIKSQLATDEAQKIEPTRRNEAQADCLAGLFFNGVQESMGLNADQVKGIGDFYGQIGNKDPSRLSTHPQPPTRYKWFNTGLNTVNIGDCNSYVAPLDEVK